MDQILLLDGRTFDSVPIIWGFFLFFFGVVAIYSVVLVYHWKKYSIQGSHFGPITLGIYFTGTSLLLALAAFSLYTFSL